MIRDLIAPNVGNTSFPKAIRKIDISNIPYFTNTDNWDDFYAIKAVGNEVVMVSATNNFIYYSNDGGATFAKTSCASVNPSFASISYTNGSFFVFTTSGYYASITNGVVSQGLMAQNSNWSSVVYFSGNYYIVGYNGSLGIGSSLGNLTYSQPFGTATMCTIKVIDGILYAAGYSGVLYRSYNGSDWELLATGLTTSIYDMVFSTQDSLFLLATTSGLYYSFDLITFTLSTVTASIRTVTVSPVNSSKIIVSNGQETTSGVAGTWSAAKTSITRCTYSTDGTIYGSGLNGYFYKDTAGSVLDSAYYQTTSYDTLMAVGYFKSTNKLMVVLSNLIVMCTVLDDNTVAVDKTIVPTYTDFVEVYELNGVMVVVYGSIDNRYVVECSRYIDGVYTFTSRYTSSSSDAIRSIQKINPNELLIGAIDKYVDLFTVQASGVAVRTSISIAAAVGTGDDILGVGIGHDGQTYIAKDDDNFVIKGVGNLNTSLGATATLTMDTSPDLAESEMVKIVSTSTKTVMAYQSAQSGELRFWLSTDNGSTWTAGTNYECKYFYSSIFKLADDIYFVTRDASGGYPLLAKLVDTVLAPHYRLRDEILNSFTKKPYIGDDYVVFYAANTSLSSSTNRYIYIME